MQIVSEHQLCFITPGQVDEPYRNIPTEQLKQQLLKEKAEKVGGGGQGGALRNMCAAHTTRALHSKLLAQCDRCSAGLKHHVQPVGAPILM